MLRAQLVRRLRSPVQLRHRSPLARSGGGGSRPGSRPEAAWWPAWRAWRAELRGEPRRGPTHPGDRLSGRELFASRLRYQCAISLHFYQSTTYACSASSYIRRVAWLLAGRRAPGRRAPRLSASRRSRSAFLPEPPPLPLGAKLACPPVGASRPLDPPAPCYF
jgi:hypothetical protein